MNTAIVFTTRSTEGPEAARHGFSHGAHRWPRSTLGCAPLRHAQHAAPRAVAPLRPAWRRSVRFRHACSQSAFFSFLSWFWMDLSSILHFLSFIVLTSFAKLNSRFVNCTFSSLYAM